MCSLRTRKPLVEDMQCEVGEAVQEDED